jgi:hypothetical protein
MDFKSIIITIILAFGIFCTNAQTTAGFSVGFSNNDKHIETLWFQHQLSRSFSAGLQFRYSQIDYRFVNAIAIKDGSTTFAGLVLGVKLKESEHIRLDFNLTASYRYLSNDDRPELPSSTNGLEFDPNIVLGFNLSESINLYTGIMLRTAMQFGETSVLDEQLPSGIVLAGLSYNINKHQIALRAYTGPMNGAGGDTMKYFNQISIGYQYTFGQPKSPLSFFNF